MKSVRALQLLLAGIWFAEVQVTSLFLLQTYYTASLQAYLLLVTAWLSGAILGVWLTQRVGPWLWFCSALASFGLIKVWVNQMALPIELSWMLLFVTAVPAGQIFQEHLGTWKDRGKMFFIEALGFAGGLVFSTLLLMKLGLSFCETVPGQAVLLWFLSLTIRREK